MWDILTSCALGDGRDKTVWIWGKVKYFHLRPCMPTYVGQKLRTITKGYGNPKSH
jgi:hypothetical protein